MKVQFAALSFLLLTACDGGLWNDPYPAADEGKSILYTAFTERPKHLDPAQAYSENEYEFLALVYSPPLQYHYLKRPYQLVPLAASEMPKRHAIWTRAIAPCPPRQRRNVLPTACTRFTSSRICATSRIRPLCRGITCSRPAT